MNARHNVSSMLVHSPGENNLINQLLCKKTAQSILRYILLEEAKVSNLPSQSAKITLF